MAAIYLHLNMAHKLIVIGEYARVKGDEKHFYVWIWCDLY